MKIYNLHSWNPTYQEAIQIQLDLAPKVLTSNDLGEVKLVAGIDVSFNADKTARSGIVVLTYPELKVVEVTQIEGIASFPYIPGLLSFRELPMALRAFEKLRLSPDLILVDGQGIAHPRRLGLACHLGLLLDIPTIGCAKSLLCGNHDEVASEAGSFQSILFDNSIVGAALRTRVKIKPVYVSPGHKIDLLSSIEWILKCCRGYRLPEPCRLAHLASKGNLKQLGL
jgi:deoxyribonuclease V